MISNQILSITKPLMNSAKQPLWGLILWVKSSNLSREVFLCKGTTIDAFVQHENMYPYANYACKHQPSWKISLTNGNCVHERVFACVSIHLFVKRSLQVEGAVRHEEAACGLNHRLWSWLLRSILHLTDHQPHRVSTQNTRSLLITTNKKSETSNIDTQITLTLVFTVAYPPTCSTQTTLCSASTWAWR